MECAQNGHTADDTPSVREFLSRVHKRIRRQSLPNVAADAQQRIQMKLKS